MEDSINEECIEPAIARFGGQEQARTQVQSGEEEKRHSAENRIQKPDVLSRAHTFCTEQQMFLSLSIAQRLEVLQQGTYEGKV